MECADILGPGGLIARRLPQYEHRREQLEMAEAVTQAFGQPEHLLVEAGTGVGKSFAYLVPAIERVTRHKQRVVVSTHTIALQEQLINQDIPFLQSVLPMEFSAVLMKGRGNYIGLRRLARAGQRQELLFDSRAAREELWRIEDWAYRTRDGSLSDLSVQPAPAVWEKVRSEQGNCMGRRCPHYERCFYQQARRRAENANLLIVNHALFFSDLAVRAQGAGILPDYDLAILDEAHTIEDVAGSHFGLSVSDGQIRYLLNSLYNERTKHGFLAGFHADVAIRAVLKTRGVLTRFTDELASWQTAHGRSNGRLLVPPPVKNTISDALRDLHQKLRSVRDLATDEGDRFELNLLMERTIGLAETTEELLSQEHEDWVYWIESTPHRSNRLTVTGRPVDIGPNLRDSLFGLIPSVVLTSATLTTGGGDDGFAYIRNRLTLPDVRACSLGSPFDYANQVTVHVEAGLPDPNQADAFLPPACAAIEKYVRQTQGRAFVLFTSYSLMDRCAEMLADRLAAAELELLVQGRELTRTQMLDRFRQDRRCVLFGTDSFWGGVDVPGPALSNVIIVKLPFAVPDHPAIEARVEQIRRQGGNPFTAFQLPEAILRFKQGFGRLVRTKDDCGIVVILDPRVCSKSYGRAFLEALPECRIVIRNGTEDENP
jgi:ATP-dependent DNA helicase DinG